MPHTMMEGGGNSKPNCNDGTKSSGTSACGSTTCATATTTSVNARRPPTKVEATRGALKRAAGGSTGDPSGSAKSNHQPAKSNSLHPKSPAGNNNNAGGKSSDSCQDGRESETNKKKSGSEKNNSSDVRGTCANAKGNDVAGTRELKVSGSAGDKKSASAKEKRGKGKNNNGGKSGQQCEVGGKKKGGGGDGSVNKKKCQADSVKAQKSKAVGGKFATGKKGGKANNPASLAEKSAATKKKAQMNKKRKQLAAKKALKALKSMFGFWKGPRLRRVASLNAQAKVQILYENEGRYVSPTESELSHKDGRGGQKRGCDSDGLPVAKKSKVESAATSTTTTTTTTTVVREALTCRRMASLNAQAILAASYSPDRPRKSVKLETELMKKASDNAGGQKQKPDAATAGSSDSTAKNKKAVSNAKESKNKTCAASVIVEKTQKVVASKVCSGSSKVQMTKAKQKAQQQQQKVQKTTVTKKATKKAESRTIITAGTATTRIVELKNEKERLEKLEDTSEVTITGVYINPNTSICISRVHTYKQSQTFSPPPSPPPSQGQASVHLSPAPPHLVAAGGVIHSAPHLPVYSFPNSVVPSNGSQTYPVNGLTNHLGNLPVVNVTMPRHYSNTFSVPHYGHSGPITYTHGFYQPAGPLIQTITDPCLIHKPVPYHPHLQQTSPALYSQEQCHPPQTEGVQFCHDQCPPHPTPPYSAQHCSQSKCGAVQPVPPSAGQFSQDRCHSHPSPQEGFFPEHCPAEGIGPQPFQHMQQSFQATATTFKAQVSPPQYVDNKPLSRPLAPTLRVQAKEERLLEQELPLQPPILTPVKNLCQNYDNCRHESKNCARQRVSDDAVVTNEKKDIDVQQLSKKRPIGSGSQLKNRTKSQCHRTGGSNLGAKVHCRRLRQEVNSLLQHKLDRLPRSHGSRIKLLRSDVRILKRRRTDGSMAESARRDCIKKARTLLQKPRGPVLRIRGPGDVVKKGLRDVSNEQGVNERNKGPDHGPPRVGSGPNSENTKGNVAERKLSTYQPCVPSYLRPVVKLKMLKRTPRYSNGWTWEGEAIRQAIQLHNDDPPVTRKCYMAMRHVEGDIIRIRDCVLLKSGPRKNDLPFVAKVAGLWENPDDGEMMISLLWYYRPEHTEQGRKHHHMEDEIFASKHKDINSVACIEDKCYVLTFNEYCRYRRRVRLLEESVRLKTSVVPDPEDGYFRKDRQPLGCVSPDMVFFCRKVYDYRQKRILKNPS